MTRDKLLEVLNFYREHTRTKAQSSQPHSNPLDLTGYQHLWYMCHTAVEEFLVEDGHVEKAMRWLGWIQCALVSKGDFSLSDVRNHSRPDNVPVTITLEEYDKEVRRAHGLRTYANQLRRKADRVEADALRRAGVEYVDREPGFPCWTVKGGTGRYYNTEREAVEAAAKAKREETNGSGAGGG